MLMCVVQCLISVVNNLGVKCDKVVDFPKCNHKINYYAYYEVNLPWSLQNKIKCCIVGWSTCCCKPSMLVIVKLDKNT